eukprot:3618078-Rhodomonas_salina.2
MSVPGIDRSIAGITYKLCKSIADIAYEGHTSLADIAYEGHRSIAGFTCPPSPNVHVHTARKELTPVRQYRTSRSKRIGR